MALEWKVQNLTNKYINLKALSATAVGFARTGFRKQMRPQPVTGVTRAQLEHGRYYGLTKVKNTLCTFGLCSEPAV